jgi:molybdenum cofactor cytidylyltransferase
MEIVTRPQPREDVRKPEGRNIGAVVLAAGRSTRMGGPNKLVADLGGKPLVRRVTEEVLSSRARPVIVVTGHQRDRVETALTGLPFIRVHNPSFAGGLSTSLKAGLAALPADVDGAVICLGDMPQVSSEMIDRMIAAFDPDRSALIVVPTFEGKRGNPVLWSRRFFHELGALEGDIGARHLIGQFPDAVVEVPVMGQGAFFDIDTPEALEAAKVTLEAALAEGR